jgi:hypothetical protein
VGRNAEREFLQAGRQPLGCRAMSTIFTWGRSDRPRRVFGGGRCLACTCEHARTPGVYPGSCRSSDFPMRTSSQTHRLSRRGPPNSVEIDAPPKTHRYCALRAPCSSESDRLVHPCRVSTPARAVCRAAVSHARARPHAASHASLPALARTGYQAGGAARVAARCRAVRLTSATPRPPACPAPLRPQVCRRAAWVAPKADRLALPGARV